jgi:hypothetical protein
MLHYMKTTMIEQFFNVIDFKSNLGGIEAIIIGFVILMYSAITDHIFIMDAIQNFFKL